MNTLKFSRFGSTNTNIILVMIVFALIVAIVFLILKPDPHKAPVESSEKKPQILDTNGMNLPPENLKEYIPQGTRYSITRKTGIVVRGKDQDWVKPDELIMIGLYCEDKFTREVEKNDGEYFVEVRTIEMDRALKVLSPNGRFEFNLDKSQDLFLDTLDFSEKDKLIPLELNINEINQIFTKLNSSLPDKGKMFKIASGTEKKKIRIVSKKGKGVVSVEPIDCELKEAEEKHYFTQTPFVVPTQLAGNLKPGDSVTIPAWLLRDSLDKLDGESGSSFPTGKVVLTRDADIKQDGDLLATFRITKDDSHLELSSDEKEGKVNLALAPSGVLKFSKSDKCIRETIFSGNLDVRIKPKNKSFNNAILLDKPLLKHTYYCKKIAG